MTRRTVRVKGEDVGLHDQIVVSFATMHTVALVGLVGTVTRIRQFDELTGETVIGAGTVADPEFWFEDHRTKQTVGPVRRSEICRIGQIDGPWMTEQEIAILNGEQ